MSVLVATPRNREQGGAGLTKAAWLMFMFSWTSAQQKNRARRSFTQHEHDSTVIVRKISSVRRISRHK